MKARQIIKEKQNYEKDYKNFLEMIVQIDPVSYIGILSLLGVPASVSVKEHGVDKKRGRAFEDTFPEVVEKYSKLSTRKRQTLNTLLKKYIKEQKQDAKKEKHSQDGDE